MELASERFTTVIRFTTGACKLDESCFIRHFEHRAHPNGGNGLAAAVFRPQQDRKYTRHKQPERMNLYHHDSHSISKLSLVRCFYDRAA